MNAKLLCRRLGRAIFELDQASWSCSQPGEERETVQKARESLMRLLTKHDYEFAACDSPRVRRARKFAKSQAG